MYGITNFSIKYEMYGKSVGEKSEIWLVAGWKMYEVLGCTHYQPFSIPLQKKKKQNGIS